MVRVLVALDESENARTAFLTALTLINQERESDQIFLLSVCEDVHDIGVWGPAFWATPAMFDEVQQKAKEPHIHLLRRYGNLCHELGLRIKPQLLLGISDHVGDMICRTCEQKHIDFLVMGRRGMSSIKRLFVGSNSRYCVEHAPCNVLIVKGEEVKGLHAYESELTAEESKKTPQELLEVSKEQESGARHGQSEAVPKEEYPRPASSTGEPSRVLSV